MKKYLLTFILLLILFIPNLNAESFTVSSASYGVYNYSYYNGSTSSTTDSAYVFLPSVGYPPYTLIGTELPLNSGYNVYALSLQMPTQQVNAISYKVSGYISFEMSGNVAFWDSIVPYLYYLENIDPKGSTTYSIETVGTRSTLYLNANVNLDNSETMSTLYLYIKGDNSTGATQPPVLGCRAMQCSTYITTRITAINLQVETYADASVGILNGINANINETNSKLDELNKNQEDLNNLISSEDEDVESTKCGMTCKLKAIWKGIINLPTLLIDGIKGLFIPEDMDFINEFVDSIENKLGFIASIPIQFIEFGLNLVTLNVEEMNTISFPSIPIFGLNFWEDIEIDLSTAKSIFQPYKIYTDILCVVLCVRALFKMYENFTGGGE